ncbi:MAG: S-layer homology domain-containing protein [bacterium]
MTGFRKIKPLAVILVAVTFLGFCPAAASAAPYSDLEGHWAEGIIEGWRFIGFVAGYPDGTFRPDQPVTRAEMAILINRVLGIKEEGGEEVFSDVPAGAWYSAEVAAASKTGIISGYGDGTFRPNNKITRQELAVLIAGLLGLQEAFEDQFSDQQAIAPWAREAVEAVAAAGILVGYPDGTFRPAAFLTRAEALAVIDNTYEAAYEAGESLASFLPEEVREGPAATGKIEIVRVEPAGDLVPGEETEFTILVNYEFAGTEEAVLYVGFNTEQVNGSSLVDRYVVKEKAGSHTFRVKALVKDWGAEGSFVAYVNISRHPHPFAWSPLDTDVWELTIAGADPGKP